MEKIYVSFHIGRGGRFNNAGHLSFAREEDFQDLVARCSDCLSMSWCDCEGNTLPEERWHLDDVGCRVLLQGRDNIEARTGRLEWDGEYDTDYVTTTDNLSTKELGALWKAYVNEDYMSEELKDEICTLTGVKRAHGVQSSATNVNIYCQDGVHVIDIDGQAGEFTREQWQKYLEECDYCPHSIEKILSAMEDCGTNDKDFFANEQ